MYPNHCISLFTMRVICTLFLIILLFLLNKKDFAEKHYKLLNHIYGVLA